MSIATVMEFDTHFRGSDLMDTGRAATELAICVEQMTVPPYYTPDEKEPRLKRAYKWVQDGKVKDLGRGFYEVAGSKPNTSYTLKDTHCECEHASKGKSRWCYHAVAVKLYQEWQRRLTPMGQQPSLGLPPITADERLAQSTTTHTQEPVMATTPSTTDFPEPEPATTLPATRASLAPSTVLDSTVLEESLAEWGKQRAVITRYIKQHFVEGTDYYTIKVGGRETKPTLGKPGAEKFLSLFQLQASFRKDADTWEMLGSPSGILCYVCTLHTRSGEIVGEGRGVRDIKKDSGDLNKAVKMGEKSSLIDAILRTGALSDAFTQDLDEGQEEVPRQGGKATPGQSAREQIVKLLKQLGFAGSSRADYEEAVQQKTGLTLVPDNYGEIVAKLTAQLTNKAA